jgi:hypothetical protein
MGIMGIFKRRKPQKEEENKKPDLIRAEEARKATDRLFNSLAPHERRNLAEMGIDEEYVYNYLQYTKEDDRELECSRLERNATMLIMEAERDFKSGNMSVCVEKFYKARVNIFEAIELHRAIDTEHPAIKILDIGLKQVDEAIRVFTEITDQLDEMDNPDYPIY